MNSLNNYFVQFKFEKNGQTCSYQNLKMTDQTREIKGIKLEFGITPLIKYGPMEKVKEPCMGLRDPFLGYSSGSTLYGLYLSHT